VIDTKAPSETLVTDSFCLGRPCFLAGGHQRLVFEFDYRADAERDNSLRTSNGSTAHFKTSPPDNVESPQRCTRHRRYAETSASAKHLRSRRE
jgi:hypothetical protein